MTGLKRTFCHRHNRGRCRVALAAMASLIVAACDTRGGAGPVSNGLVSNPTGETVVAFDHGLVSGWVDYGWAATLAPGSAAKVDLGGWGGWILARPGLGQRHADLDVEVQLPSGVDSTGLVRVRLGNDGDEFPAVALTFRNNGDSSSAHVLADQLNPDGLAFDRIILQAARDVPKGTTLVVQRVSLPLVTPPRPVASAVEPATVSADCRAAGAHPISPDIYGVALSASREGTTDEPWDLGITSRRWGGNPTSRYNWQDGHAWNTAADWFWQNVAILKGEEPAWQQFLRTNRNRGVGSAITLPTIGWVAKDTSSYSFPVSEFGAQQAADPSHPDMGNGNRSDGKPIPPGNPQRTSIEASPGFVAAWVRAMEASGAAPRQYILDNEPDLWHDTHRDVHPDPLTYDELATRIIEYGAAVRQAAPGARIAGPASWGWWGYSYSAADAVAGFDRQPDRKAHGDQPLLEWLLDQVRQHEQRTGVRTLDVLDVHYYPQSKNVYTNGGKGGADRETGRLRVRSTRSLWDPSYTDESWIKQNIRLLPRMKQLIAEHNPGLGLSIGEYSFGGENTPSGAVAQAEALGRFAEYDVESAYYWTYPTTDSAVGTAFRAFRNYDGKGGHFLPNWVPSTSSADVSMFTSTDGKDVVAVLVNRSDTAQKLVSASFMNCGDLPTREAYQYDGSSNTLRPMSVGTGPMSDVQLMLPAWSITTIHLSPQGVKS